jgi:hypothetical protein
MFEFCFLGFICHLGFIFWIFIIKILTLETNTN